MSSFRKRVLVTGGAGFLGSHLCERLITQGDDVLCVDNYFTGRKDNVGSLLALRQFEAMRHDITHPLFVEVDEIYNLACPASPIHYQRRPPLDYYSLRRPEARGRRGRMVTKLIFKYDRDADILHIDKRSPYPEQESKELGDEVIARLNPDTSEVENLEVLFFSTRLLRSELFELPISAELRITGGE